MISHLDSEDVAKYRYFLELSQLDSSTKPCPHCSLFTTLKEHNPNRSEHKYKVRGLVAKHQLASEKFCCSVWKVTKHSVSALDLPRRRSSVVIASSCGALNATRRGITGSNVVSIGKETSCCEPGRVS